VDLLNEHQGLCKPRRTHVEITRLLIFLCPKRGAATRIVAILADFAGLDSIINHLKQPFVAKKSPL